MSLISDIKRDQQKLATQFSDAYCTEVWIAEMGRRGFDAAISKRSHFDIFATEMRRSLMKTWANGRTRVRPFEQVGRQPISDTFSIQGARQRGLATLEDGIDFSKQEYPSCVHIVDGLSEPESWGRWSIAKCIMIVLVHRLEGRTRLYLRLCAYGPNGGQKCTVKLGRELRSIVLPMESEGIAEYALDFEVAKPSNEIEIEVPLPTLPDNDGRSIGVGLIEVLAAGQVRMSAAEAKSAYGSSLEDGLDFSATKLPPFVAVAIGLCEAEPWGRWSLGEVVQIELKHILEGNFTLHLLAVGYGANAARPVVIKIGQIRKTIQLPAVLAEQDIRLDFALPAPSSRILIQVPYPIIPPNDNRRIGIGLVKLKVAPT